MANPRYIIPDAGGSAVSYALKVNGQFAPLEIRLYGLLVNREINRIPYARLSILDGSVTEGRFEVSETDWFVPGNELEIFLGYGEETQRIFKGIVIRQEFIVRSQDSMLMVECRDTAYRMTLRREGRYFESLTDSELAGQLLGNYNIPAEIAETRVSHPVIVQYDCSDWDLLLSRMESNGMFVRLLDGKAFIQPPDFEPEEILLLQHGLNIIEFEGGIESRDQFETVRLRSWRPESQEPTEIEARSAGTQKLRENGNLQGEALAGATRQRELTWRHGGSRQDAEMQAWADARLMKDRMSRSCGRVLINGHTAPLPGQIAEIQGFGKRMDGRVYVSAVHHEWAETGWTTEIEFGLSPKWFAETVNMEAPAAAAMLPTATGLQIGIVTQIDEDPEGGHRIRLNLPVLEADKQGFWARVARPDAGTGRGTFFLPEIGDEVVVGFIHNDPRDAVVLGMLHSLEKPAPFTANRDNHEKGYVSREGLAIRFHEKDGSIMLETPGGNRLTLSDKGKGLRLSDQHGNEIIMDASGITLNSARDLRMEAKGLCETKAVSWKTKASAEAELNAGGVTVIKGSFVKIN